MLRVRRVAGNLHNAEVAVGERRDLREMRDRDHLRPLRQPAQHAADGVRGLSADAGVDLVEDERLAARDRGDGERDARQLAAGGRLRDGRERHPRVGADEEDGVVGAGGAGVALAQLDEELPFTHADVVQLRRDRVGEGGSSGVPLRAKLGGERVDARLRLGERLRRRRRRVGAAVERGQLGARVGGAVEQLLVGRAAEPPLRVGDPVEPGLQLLEAARLRLERGEECVQVGRDLAQPQLGVAQLVAGALELRREPLQRRHRPLGEPDEPGGSLAVVGRERVRGGRSALGELGDMAKPLALAAQRLLAARLHPLGVLDERVELGEPRLRERCVRRQLLVAPSRGQQLPPGGARLAPPAQLLLAAEPVEHLELVCRPREPPLLELARHGDHPLDGGADVLACRRAAPRIRARAPVAEDAAGDEQRVLVLGPELDERLQLLRVVLEQVELRLDVRLRPGRADERIVALRPEQEPDRLGQDRLPRTGLAGDRVEPGRELQLRLPDQHEVLDAQPSQHPVDGSRAARRRPLAGRDRVVSRRARVADRG